MWILPLHPVQLQVSADWPHSAVPRHCPEPLHSSVPHWRAQCQLAATALKAHCQHLVPPQEGLRFRCVCYSWWAQHPPAQAVLLCCAVPLEQSRALCSASGETRRDQCHSPQGNCLAHRHCEPSTPLVRYRLQKRSLPWIAEARRTGVGANTPSPSWGPAGPWHSQLGT